MAADRKLRVMITSGGGPGVWGLLYALRTLPGRRAHVIVQDPDPAETLGTLLADERACLPPAADATYIDRLLEHCRGRGVDVLVPVYDGELTAIARRRADFADAGVTLLLPPTEVVTSCADKWSLHERLAGGDLLPPHRLVRTMRETAEAIEQLGYPQQRLCVRPINLAGGRGVHFLDPTADRFAQQMLAKPGPIICTASDFLDMRRGGPTEFPLVIAEFLPGDDLGIDLLADSGRVVEMVVRRKGGALHAGNPMRMDFAQRPGEREWVARLSATLGLSGLVNVDARYDERGTLRLLEINPRPSACIGMSCAVVHLLGWAIDRALSEKCDASRYRMPEAAGAVVRAIADVAVLPTGPRLIGPFEPVNPGKRASVPARLLPVGNREHTHRLETGSTAAGPGTGAAGVGWALPTDSAAGAGTVAGEAKRHSVKHQEALHASALPGRAS